MEFYKTIAFGYAILDEAQHIKNRGTRNAQSVKLIQAAHRLILTGTPIENSLDELWSLFDFLMPGLLSTYDRFVEKYIRHSPSLQGWKKFGQSASKSRSLHFAPHEKRCAGRSSSRLGNCLPLPLVRNAARTLPFLCRIRARGTVSTREKRGL